MTVEVETPYGLRTGTSVWQTKSYRQWSIVAKGYFQEKHGEAVVVDIGERKLFAVMMSETGDVDYPISVAGQTIRIQLNDGKYDDNLDILTEAAKESGTVFTLSRQYYPLLVAFDDIRDPKTAFKVNPDDLASAFGTDVRLKRITVQFTNDQVNTGIASQLPWLQEYRNKNFAGKEFPDLDDLIGRLSSGAFSTEK